jgi:FKBP-type peptidyl-prolyl cis-trans isomerase SlyD
MMRASNLEPGDAAAVKIIKNSVVALKYEVFDARGELVERGTSPYWYLHGGYQGVFPRVEEALAGKEVGEKVRVKLAAADGFGEPDPALVRVEPRGRFSGKLKLGMQVRGQSGEGDHAHPIAFRVVKIDGDEVTLDANHPLAGQAIEFRCTVLEVRPATAEEIAHGHAHGPGGHHH